MEGWAGILRLIIVFPLQSMQREQLAQFTRNKIHHGCNNTHLLQSFLSYARQCSDPLNVYRYMEEKAICTFLPTYWIAKARLLADAGDYRACLDCMDEARSRCGIGGDGERDSEEGESREEVEAEERALMEGLRQEMVRSPQRGKRSVDEFEMLTSVIKSEMNQQDPQRYEQLLGVYETKFASLRQEKDRRERERREGLEKSWMSANYEKEELQEHKIEERIHENSVKLSREIKYHSMHTPQKERSTMRLNKAMDSVQIMKKKRSTHDKKSRPREQEDSEKEELMVNSVPVGRRLVQQYNRRVTFVDLMGKHRHKDNLEISNQKQEDKESLQDKTASKTKLHKTASISHPEESSNTAKTMPDLRSL